MRVAVLDLGTNTFNLVVAEGEKNDFSLIHSSKLPVKLGEGGIHRSTLTQQAFDRGIASIEKHYHTLTKLNVDCIKAYGTSALRSAQNGSEFLETIRMKTGIEVEIIDGDREAELICYGVRQTHPMNRGKYLILDIGGGSNEFVIADSSTIYWKKSYDLGIARLLEKFQPSDPLEPNEVFAIMQYLDREMSDLYDQVTAYAVHTLLGASGSFETFVAMIGETDIDDETQASTTPETYPIDPEDFDKLYHKLINSTTQQRAKMKGLEPMRIEMIVLACLFVKFIIGKLGIKEIFYSNYSLKEGAIYQLYKQ